MPQTSDEIAKDILVAALARSDTRIGGGNTSELAAKQIAIAFKIIAKSVDEAMRGNYEHE